MKARYFADDGTEFDTAEAAREHDKSLADNALVGLKSEDIEDAVAGTNAIVAEGIKRAYARIQAARQERGEVKPRKKGEPAATNGQLGSPPPTAGPESRGAADFIAGKDHRVPEDLRGDKDAAERWTTGWSNARIAQRESGTEAA